MELEDIMSVKQPVTGSLFCKRVMQEVHNKIMQQDYDLTYDGDERPLVSVKKNWMPTMTWEEDSLILQSVPKGEIAERQQDQGPDSVFHRCGCDCKV